MALNMASFDPEQLLKTFAEHKITFTSLVPTHYIMMLALPDEVKNKYDVSCVKKLLCSSAPARRDTKLAIMDYFKNSKLYECYGSTEAGTVTVLQPEDALRKLGSVGRECISSDLIKLIDDAGNEIDQPNVVGEVYSRSPMLFDGYWKAPEQTEKAFRGRIFQCGRHGLQGRRGLLLPGRPEGEHDHLRRGKRLPFGSGERGWQQPQGKGRGSHRHTSREMGEQVAAVVVLHEGKEATEQEISDYCRGKVAGYKAPKKVIFISDSEMPRSGAGKILHRILGKDTACGRTICNGKTTCS